MIYWTKRTFSNVAILALSLLIVVVALLMLGSSAKILLSAFALAYLTHPLAVTLERWGVTREISITSVFIIAIATVVLSLMALIPFLASEIQSLILSLPGLIQNLSERIKALSVEYHIPVPFEPGQVLIYLQDHLSEFLQTLSVHLWQSAKNLFTNSLAGVLWLLNLFLFPVFYFYLMTDYEKIALHIQQCIPPNMRTRGRHLGARVTDILSGYIRGQFLVCLAQAVLYSGGLTILNIRFGVLIGLVGGLLTMIPYVGFCTIVVSSLVMALTMSAEVSTYIGLVILYSIAQVVETYILTPKLVGKRVGLGPLGTILALIAGANLGGVFGMIVAIPLGGILKVIARDLWNVYHHSSVYLDT